MAGSDRARDVPGQGGVLYYVDPERVESMDVSPKQLLRGGQF